MQRTEEEIRNWLVTQVAAELAVAPSQVNVRVPLTQLGLDSMTAVMLSGDLEEWLGITLPPGLVSDYGTIEALARHLAAAGMQCATAVALESRPSEAGSTILPSGPLDTPAMARVLRGAILLLARLLTRMDIEGGNRIPVVNGPRLLAINHLHILDAPLAFTFLPASAFFVSDHMRRFPLVNWLLRHLGRPIYVVRGEGDRDALSRALSWLNGGGVLVMAPEGKISKTGGLLYGRAGLAYLAFQSGAAILPIVMYGQEKAWRYWLSLRRVPVHVRIGQPLSPPAGKPSGRQLEGFTHKVMQALSDMLPPEYQGVYRCAATHPRND